MKYLLDTHVLLHYSGQSPKLDKQHEQIIMAATADNPLYLSDISLWEIATLCSLKRISIPNLDVWLEQVTSAPLITRVRISTKIAAEVANLPDSFHCDPADRLIVATAKILNATIVTQDEKIINAQLVKTI